MNERDENGAAPPDEREADEQLRTTAEDWRESVRGTDAEKSADEVARGAENAARQPGFGREGS